jgi:hypothetical protein
LTASKFVNLLADGDLQQELGVGRMRLINSRGAGTSTEQAPLCFCDLPGGRHYFDRME